MGDIKFKRIENQINNRTTNMIVILKSELINNIEILITINLQKELL